MSLNDIKTQIAAALDAGGRSLPMPERLTFIDAAAERLAADRDYVEALRSARRTGAGLDRIVARVDARVSNWLAERPRR